MSVNFNKNGNIITSSVYESKSTDILNNSYKYVSNPITVTGKSTDIIVTTDMYSQVTPGKTYYLLANADKEWSSGHGSSVGAGKCTIWLYLSKTFDASNMGYDYPLCFTSSNWIRKGVWKYKIPSEYNMARVRLNTYSDGTNEVTAKFNDIHLIEEVNYIDNTIASSKVTKSGIVITDNIIEY